MGVNPSLIGCAVNVITVPEQEGFWDAVTVTLTASMGLTDTGYWMLDAGLLVAHVSEEVRVQETRSLLLGMNE